MNRKKIMIIAVLCICVTMLSSCSVMPLTALSSMFPERFSSSDSAAKDSASSAVRGSGATVTISKAEYERYRKFDTLLEIMDNVDSMYYQDVNESTLLEGAAKGMLDNIGDPYTFYYSPDDFSALWEDDKGEYAGIGVLISASYVTNLCTITRVFKGGPAEAAGVQKGDILYRVGDDLMVTAENLTEAVNIMRGEPGTDVEVTFLRKGEEMTYTITRNNVTVNRIDSMMLDDQIGYIYLYEFAGNCAAEFEEALNGLIKSGAKGLIIDLRDNGGGWVNDAQSIADLFLDKGTVFYMEFKNGERQYYSSNDGKVEMPLVILVNQFTASASEILTGALRDRAEATVVGTKSFGKGITQVVLGIGEEGAGMQVTNSQYFTPNGTAVHHEGITPDVVVEMPEDAPTMYDLGDLSDVQLKQAYDVMVEKLAK